MGDGDGDGDGASAAGLGISDSGAGGLGANIGIGSGGEPGPGGEPGSENAPSDTGGFGFGYGESIGAGALAAQANAQAAMAGLGYGEAGFGSIGQAVGTDAGNLGTGFGLNIGGFGFGPSIGVNGFGIGTSEGFGTVGQPSVAGFATPGFGNIGGFTGVNEGFGIPGANLGFNEVGTLSQAAINTQAEQDAVNAISIAMNPALSFATPTAPPGVNIAALPGPPASIDAQIGELTSPLDAITVDPALNSMFALPPQTTNLPTTQVATTATDLAEMAVVPEEQEQQQETVAPRAPISVVIATPPNIGPPSPQENAETGLGPSLPGPGTGKSAATATTGVSTAPQAFSEQVTQAPSPPTTSITGLPPGGLVGPTNAVPGFPSEIGVTPTQSMPDIGVTATPSQLSTGTFGGLSFGTSIYGSPTDTASQLGMPNIPQSHINTGFSTIAPQTNLRGKGPVLGVPISREQAMENEALATIKGVAPKGLDFNQVVPWNQIPIETPVGPHSSISDTVGNAISALMGISTAQAEENPPTPPTEEEKEAKEKAEETVAPRAPISITIATPPNIGPPSPQENAETGLGPSLPGPGTGKSGATATTGVSTATGVSQSIPGQVSSVAQAANANLGYTDPTAAPNSIVGAPNLGAGVNAAIPGVGAFGGQGFGVGAIGNPYGIATPQDVITGGMAGISTSAVPYGLTQSVANLQQAKAELARAMTKDQPPAIQKEIEEKQKAVDQMIKDLQKTLEKVDKALALPMPETLTPKDKAIVAPAPTPTPTPTVVAQLPTPQPSPNPTPVAVPTPVPSPIPDIAVDVPQPQTVDPTAKGNNLGINPNPPPPTVVTTVPVPSIAAPIAQPTPTPTPTPVPPPPVVEPLPKEVTPDDQPNIPVEPPPVEEPKEVVPLPKEKPEEAKPPPVVVPLERAPPTIVDTPLTRETLKDLNAIPPGSIAPAMPAVAAAPTGTLGTGVTGFSAGQNIADWINQGRRIAAETGIPVTAVTAMQSLYNMPIQLAQNTLQQQIDQGARPLGGQFQGLDRPLVPVNPGATTLPTQPLPAPPNPVPTLYPNIAYS